MKKLNVPLVEFSTRDLFTTHPKKLSGKIREIKMSDTVVTEFIEKLTRIEGEIQLLAEDRKELINEFKDRIDMKALMAAIRIVKIKSRLGSSESECETYMCEIDGRVS